METETPSGRLEVSGLDANSVRAIERRYFERMRQQHSEWVKRGMASQVAKGRHVHRVPVGYKLDWNERIAKVEPDPVQAVHVQQPFLIAANGNTSVRKLLKVMTERGLANSCGKPLSASGFHSMLTNLFYTGTVRSGEALPKARIHLSFPMRHSSKFSGSSLPSGGIFGRDIQLDGRAVVRIKHTFQLRGCIFI